MMRKRIALTIPVLVGLLSLGSGPMDAEARSRLPYFSGVDRLGVSCRAPDDRQLAESLCVTVARLLGDGLDQPVEVGSRGMSDPATLHVLVSAVRAPTPAGDRVLAVSLDLFRAGHVDSRLWGPAPILLPIPDAPGADAGPPASGALAAPLNELVVLPLGGTPLD